MFNQLIGSQLVEFSEKGFVVKCTNGNLKRFVFELDCGDCCGFNDLVNTLLISECELSRNPVITKIEQIDVSHLGHDGNHIVITFFGEAKKLAEIDSHSSSGSGWRYGACVTLRCLETDKVETITSW